MRLFSFIAALLIAFPASGAWIAQDPTSSTDWLNRKKITLNDTPIVGGPHTNFPVLIAVTDTDLSDAQADADDFRFTTSDETTELDFEIQEWTDGTGKLCAWVRIPSLLAAGQDIYIYYNNSAVAGKAASVAEATWKSDYTMVLHLNDNGMLDSTDNSNDGTANTTSAIAGHWCGGTDWGGPAEDDYVSITHHADIDIASGEEFLISSWMDPTGNPGGDHLYWITKRSTTGDDRGWLCGFQNTTVDEPSYFQDKGAANDTINAGININNTGTFHHIACRRTGDTVRLYVDAVEKVSVAGYSGSLENSDEMRLGRSGTGYTIQSYNGAAHEVRFSTNDESANWITTEFNNGDDPSGASPAFATFATEESGPPAAGRRIIISKMIDKLKHDLMPWRQFYALELGL